MESPSKKGSRATTALSPAPVSVRDLSPRDYVKKLNKERKERATKEEEKQKEMLQKLKVDQVAQKKAGDQARRKDEAKRRKDHQTFEKTLEKKQ